ncbi:unnamed protein product [Rotaria socialis]|nr:unnamed protein product [Rotaria socialis]CAF4501549.1 unnamed protein product [Rotaria socialis]
MKDAIVIFICFILIILFGFSVASWSLLTTKEQVIWPNSTNESFSNATVVVQGADVSSSWQLLRDVFNWGIWKVFGQVAEPYNDAVSENDAYGTFVFLFSIGFTVISNVLLLNVLIAMFNEKIQRVQEKSNELWRHQRFWLIYEIKDKTVLPPPLNTLCYLGQFIKYIYCRCKRLWKSPPQRQHTKKPTEQNSSADIDIILSSVDTRQTNREKAIAASYWERIFQEEKQNKTLNKENDGMDKRMQNYDHQQSFHETLQTQKQLELSDKQIGDKGAQQLADIIRKTTTLTQLDLSKNLISDQGVQYLTDALLNNKVNLILTSSPFHISRLSHQTIITLDLAANNIRAQGVQYVADVCRNNKILTNINLSNNQIGDNGAQHLADVIPYNTTLTTLKLENNQIGDHGAESLANALRHDTTLTTISLAVNNIEAQGVRHLAQALSNNTTLTVLKLSSNKIGDQGAHYLADILRNNTTLTALNLSSNEIGYDGVEHLADAVKNSKVNFAFSYFCPHASVRFSQIITTLDIGSNGIGDEGVQHLINALKNNKTLTTINLSSNQIGVTTTKDLAQTIGYTTTLTQLDLSYNQLEADGIQELAPTLRLNTVK